MSKAKLKERTGTPAFGSGGPQRHMRDIAKTQGRVRGLQHSGDIHLAFLRGYQSGYEDRVMGKEPEHLAYVSRKDVRDRDE